MRPLRVRSSNTAFALCYKSDCTRRLSRRTQVLSLCCAEALPCPDLCHLGGSLEICLTIWPNSALGDGPSDVHSRLYSALVDFCDLCLGAEKTLFRSRNNTDCTTSEMETLIDAPPGLYS